MQIGGERGRAGIWLLYRLLPDPGRTWASVCVALCLDAPISLCQARRSMALPFQGELFFDLAGCSTAAGGRASKRKVSSSDRGRCGGLPAPPSGKIQEESGGTERGGEGWKASSGDTLNPKP